MCPQTSVRLAPYVLSLALAIVMLPAVVTGDDADTPRPAEAIQDASKTVVATDDPTQEASCHWVAGRTSVSDLSAEERENLLGTRLPDDYEARLQEIRRRPPAYPLLELPERFDWCDSAGVSPVRQQLCGDCWAQASVGAMECQLRIFDKDNTQLSVQQAVDCNYGNSSCRGGWTTDTYDLYRVAGAVSESCYPYVGTDGNCAHDTCEILALLDTYEYIDTTVVSLKTHLMTHGPMAVAMTVYSSFYSYTSGCYEDSGSAPVNHGVLLVGWDDTMCAGAGAWHIRNSWGTDWGEDGYAWLKYGTCNIGEGATVIYYTPNGPVSLAYDSCVIDDSSGDADGRADPGETITLPVTLANQGWQAATAVSATIMTSTPGVDILTGSATFGEIGPDDTGQSDPPHFCFAVDSTALCGLRIKFDISITCDQGLHTDEFDLAVGDVEIVFSDDAGTDLGWSLSAADDDATGGHWKRRKPIGSFLDSMLVQPELDHTPGTEVRCFVTSSTLRLLAPDAADVDGGKTTLTTPLFDLSDRASAMVTLWRWYSNDTGEVTDDVWTVDASDDSGTTWVNLETKTDSERDWVPVEFDLGDYIDLSDRVLMRFVASDYGAESTVEAAIDDIAVTGCPYWVDGIGPSIEVIAPNGGEEIVENSQFEIEWAADDDYGLREVLVLASYDGGITYPDTIGVASGFDSVMTWHVPHGEHPSCRIGIDVTDRGYNTAFDESDSTFRIVLDVSGVGDETAGQVPDRIELLGGRGNPFTGRTDIFFTLPRSMHVRIGVYDVLGRRVRALTDGQFDEGCHSVMWEGRSVSGATVSPGIYFIRLEAAGEARTMRVVLTR